MKTVHGAEFYANKKHKGLPLHDANSGLDRERRRDGRDGNQQHQQQQEHQQHQQLQEQHIDSSPCSDDLQGGKPVSVSSPTIKSESDPNSPGRMAAQAGSSTASVSDCLMHIYRQDDLNSPSVPTLDECWPYDDDVDAVDLPIVLRAMVNMGNGNGAPCANLARQRFRSRLQTKVINSSNSMLSNIPESNHHHRAIGIIELNQRITELKMEPGTSTVTPQPMQSGRLSTGNCNGLQLTELHNQPMQGHNRAQGQGTNHLLQQGYTQAQQRRDSQNSNASTYYCSMQSRRSSQSSQLSSMSTMRACPVYNTASGTPSLYDPISPGCSRRSSQISNVVTAQLPQIPASIMNDNSSSAHATSTNAGQQYIAANGSRNSTSLPPPPSSHLIATHFQRFQSNDTNGHYHNNNANPSQSQLTVGQSGGRFSTPNVLQSPPLNSKYLYDELIGVHHHHRRQSEPIMAQLSIERMRSSPTFNPQVFHNNINRASSSTTNTGHKDCPGEIKTKTTAITNSRDHHPNEKINLDEVEELILPDEMLQYLNLVKETEKPKAKPLTDVNDKASFTNSSQYLDLVANAGNSPTHVPNCPSPFMQQLMSPQSGHTMSALGSPYSQRNYELEGGNNSAYRQQQRLNTESSSQYPYAPGPAPIAGAVPLPAPAPSQAHSLLPFGSLSCEQQQQIASHQNQIIDSSMTSLPELSNVVTVIPVDQKLNNVSEIQCGVVSQSQLSPTANITGNGNTNVNCPIRIQNQNQNQNPGAAKPISGQAQHKILTDYQTNNMASMHSDTYQRTLEYVQSCQNWMESNSSTSMGNVSLNTPATHNNHQPIWPDVSSSTHPHPSTNLIINDMTTSLSSLLEENRYLQMMQ